MALRCMLGKLGNNNKFLHNKGRVTMLGTFEVFKHKNKELLSMAFPTHSSPHHFGDLENRASIPMATRREVLDYHTEVGGLRPARFALEEFNKIKKAQLQLVRVVGLWMKPQGYPHDPCHCLYVVVMEAVDADGVALLYQARVQLHDLTEGGMFLEAVYGFYDNYGLIRYIRLYHHLDNFYNSMFPESATEWWW
ncbi:hypothetical protein RchiOBHm_Chr2g0143271 [Rosa chinensis]|uniref:Uncharacterized protein n=1 Tax=Rosa chinensis TaxID=74649 RepID=A0A2P6RY33_ROSCH|nr:uncharacterized protein LOC112190760 [Rosa chinensis]PRQ51337.1 hypothetical protein RchiOBHm_Chr2g0143271 [Rosa chinensis]